MGTTQSTDQIALGLAANSMPESEDVEHLDADDFKSGRILGVGGSATVRLCTQKSTGRYYALKALYKAGLLQQSKKRVPETRIRERFIHPQLQHPFIVGVLGCFQDARCLYMVLEYLPGGELLARLSEERRFSSAIARFYTAQVVEMFDYLHSRSIIYRSLKPEDLVLGADGYARLVDFGFAKKLAPGEQTFTLCGTPEYLAPEVVLNKGHGKAVDWYALGVLLYEMSVGEPPFSGEDQMEICQKILAGKMRAPSEKVATHVRSLIKGLLSSNPEERVGARGGAAAVRGAALFDGMRWTDLLEKKIPAPHKPTLKGEGDVSYFPAQEEEGAADNDPLKRALDPSSDIFLQLW